MRPGLRARPPPSLSLLLDLHLPTRSTGNDHHGVGGNGDTPNVDRTLQVLLQLEVRVHNLDSTVVAAAAGNQYSTTRRNRNFPDCMSMDVRDPLQDLPR